MATDETEDPFIPDSPPLDPTSNGNDSFRTNKNRHHSSYARTLLKRDACGYAKIVVSTLAHVGILVCFLAAIWMLILHNSVEFLLVPALCAIAFYVTILLEAVTCETHAALRRLDLSQNAESYTDTVRQAAPLVLWKAHAYHYERAESEVNDDNKRRRSPVSLQRMAMAGRRKTTVSCQQNCTLQYESWRDATVNMSGVFLTSIIRVESSKVFIFKDDASHRVYMQQYTKFRDDNILRDELVEHTEALLIPGFRERSTLYRDVGQRLWWFNPSWFWLSTLVLMTWPYRWLFARRSCSVYVIFVKELDVASSS